MAKMMVISFAGIFTADITKSIVTRPADGIEAAPTDATVAVKLIKKESVSLSLSFRLSFLAHLTIIN